MNITEFLEARIAEDEAAATNAGSHTYGDTFANDNYGSLLIQPARVLAECAAKREIIEGIIPERDPQTGHPDYDPLWIIRVLAAVYKDHPDYQQEWAE